MRTFPDITPETIDAWGFWWVILIPLGAFVLGAIVEFIIRKASKTHVNAFNFQGVGYGIMALSGAIAFLIAMGFVPDSISTAEDNNMIASLEDIGFEEIRMNFDEGTFGAYYEGELMRGVVVEDQTNPGTFKVVETPPPS